MSSGSWPWASVFAVLLPALGLVPTGALRRGLGSAAAVLVALGLSWLAHQPDAPRQALPAVAVCCAVGALVATIVARLHEGTATLRERLREAQETARERSQFVASISHELRTPLNAIVNIPGGLIPLFHESRVATCPSCTTDFLLEPHDEVNPLTECSACGKPGLERSTRLTLPEGADTVARYLRLIEKSAKHLLNVVNDVLDFSRLGAGRMSLNVESVDARNLCKEVLETLAPMAEKKGIQLELAEMPEELRAFLDPIKCAQVLVNLVGNAIKFSPPGRRVLLAARNDGDVLRISVVDEGPGMVREDHERIFEAFFQTAGQDARLGGTGLGLSIAKQLVELHGGTLSVESAVNKGSTFNVVLPLHASGVGAAASQAKSARRADEL
ncbi:MAG: sensor histidine kinase [Myxococcaceae bacterium]